MIGAAPGGWTLETVQLSHVSPAEPGQRACDGPAHSGGYMIVRRNGRTVRWIAASEHATEADAMAAVAATGFPLAELTEADRAYPPATFDPWLADRRHRRAVGGTAAYAARR